MRSGEVDGAIGLQSNHFVGNGGSRSLLADDQRLDAGTGQNFRRYLNKALTHVTWISSHDHTCAFGFFRSHIARNAHYSPPNIGHGELVSDNGAPARSSELDLRSHQENLT